MNGSEKTAQEYIDEIKRLSDLLAEKERSESEALLFKELFPGIDKENIPDSVKAEADEKGLPLIAAYAIYERRRQLAVAAAEAHNRINAGRSSGSLGKSDNFGEALSIEQIRAMSPTEVRKHYKQIMKTLSNQ